jgi:hypothetical protein
LNSLPRLDIQQYIQYQITAITIKTAEPLKARPTYVLLKYCNICIIKTWVVERLALPEKEVFIMTTFEAITLMISFATLVVLIIQLFLKQK